jgi:hypothetical protein
VRQSCAFVAWMIVLSFSGTSFADDWAEATLTEQVSRLLANWSVGSDLQATAQITVDAVGALNQPHGGRVSVYKQDGTFVARREVVAGSSESLSFQLPTGSYYLLFDLGVQDPEGPVGSIRIKIEGGLTDLLTQEPIPIRPQDVPPDPQSVPPSNLGTPGVTELPPSFFTPVNEIRGPNVHLMQYLIDLIS